MANQYAWEPTDAYRERANVTRLMRLLGAVDIDDLRRRAVEDVEAYWAAVVEDLGIRFDRPYDRVLDLSRGNEWARWFVGGELNIAAGCVDRHAESHPDSTAVVCEREDGSIESLTYRELRAAVDRAGRGLLDAGVVKGDAVAVYMPMIPEAVVAMHAIAKVGAIYLPVFSGFAPGAVSARLNDANVKLVFTADGAMRRGRESAMKLSVDEALIESPSVRHVVVFANTGTDVTMTPGRDIRWEDFLSDDLTPLESRPMDAEDPFMLAYTSGTTGKPKGAVHVHGGFLVKIASEVAYQTDLHRGDVLYWFTDMGWIMGPWETIGAGALGATVVLYDGSPDFPEPDRLWRSVAVHGVNVLGVSPTLIRALKPLGEDWVNKHDLSTLRILASTGEPWNPEPYTWLSETVGEGRLPIVNISGGTEVGACFLSPYPVEPIKMCSLGGASLGMDIDVFDPDGNSLTGGVGELVCKQPWPGMTRGIWGDAERYIQTYWSTYPGIWRHGDWALVDDEGDWFLLGRSDDTLNVAGKRLGPAEVESILVSHSHVAEAAVVGVPHETKGEAIWCFCVATGDTSSDTAAELTTLVVAGLGKPFKPSKVVFVEALPKTRSAKILRRAVRAVVVGEDPGDLSSAENPEAVESIRRLLAAQAPTAGSEVRIRA